MITILAAGCGTGTGPAGGDPAGLQLAWPPPEDNVRQASDDIVTLNGVDYGEAGGDFYTFGTSLVLGGSENLNYAIYSLGGFNNFVKPDDLTVTFDIIPASAGDMYILLANYDRGHWEWSLPDPTQWMFNFVTPNTYLSPAGTLHVAMIFVGGGNGWVNELAISRSFDENIPAPENLRGSSEVGAITLNWNPVAYADGYNIYRARDFEFTLQVMKLNDDPIVDLTFADTTVQAATLYYYEATAVLLDIESPPSNRINVFSPAEPLPAPANLRVVEKTFDSVTVAWDWDMEWGSPKNFALYVKTEPDFDLEPPFFYKSEVIPPFIRQLTIGEMESGVVYYCRVAAKGPSGLGDLSDDIPMTVAGTWIWGPVEEMGPGNAPVVMIEAAGELSAAYFNGAAVYVGRRNLGSWTTESSGLDENAVAVGFDGFMDMDYGGGNHLLAAKTHIFDSDNDAPFAGGNTELWCSVGNPGEGWEPEFIMVGSRSGALPQPSAGLSCRAAASATEFAIIHMDYDISTIWAHTRQQSGSTWAGAQVHVVEDKAFSSLIDQSMAFFADNLYVAFYDFKAQELLFGDRGGGYSLSPVGIGNGLGSFSDLQRFGDGWLTSAYYGPEKDFYAVSESGGVWGSTPIAAGSKGYGRLARMAVSGTEAFAIFLAGVPARWQLAIYQDSAWTFQPLAVPGSNPGIDGADIAILDGSPYFVFEDLFDGKIKVVKGTPPPPE